MKRTAYTVAAGLALLLLAAIVALMGPRPTAPNLGTSPAGKSVTVSDIDPADVRVLDGDTVRLYGAKPDYRLVGFNAPETRRPACDAEAQLGAKATRRLRELVAAGGLTIERVPCACPAGTEGTDRCNFGRYCGTLRAHGRDVGDVLIGEGLAVAFRCSGTRCPALPRPWCG